MRQGNLDLLRPPSRICESLWNVWFFKVRIESQNLSNSLAGGHQTDDRTHRHPKPTNARLSTHDLGVSGDPIERLHDLPEHGL
jgi:hypothetical protein